MSALAVLAAWLRTIDRQDLKRQVLLSPDARQKKGKKGIEPGKNGRQPGTLKAPTASREKRTLASLAPWGIKPKHAGVSLSATREARRKVMTDKAHAMRQTALSNGLRAAIVTPNDGANGRSSNCSEAGQTQRLGQGGVQEPSRYFQGFKSFRRDPPEKMVG